MKYLLSAWLFLLLIATPVKAMADVITGVQLPDSSAINRLVPSQYSFQWVKFQYSLGSLQPLETWIDTAKKSAAGGGGNYKILISVAKNLGGIETLQNPDYPPLPYPDEYTHQYCPWDEELEQYERHRTVDCEVTVDCLDINGQPSVCREPSKCDELYYVTATLKADNGYVKFRNLMQDLAPRLQKVDAVEIWNEPNLAVEWTGQGLGPLSPENYVNFLNCGIKGLRKGGYTGKIISAAPSPNAPNGPTSLDTVQFFNAFIAAGGLNGVDYIGWHSNVTANIPPGDSNPQGFQSVKYALNKGKPVWITEFGWKRDVLDSDESKARQLQAHYIAQAYDVAKNINGIEAMFVWNFGFSKVDRNNPDFYLWDIEGTTPEGVLCQPNAEITKYRRDRGSTKYVQDQSLTDDVIVATVAGQALLPKVVIEDASLSALPVTETRVDARESFLDDIPGLLAIINWLFSAFHIQICGFLGSFSEEFCKPNISIGIAEETDQNGIAPGKNIPKFASQAKILGQTAIPTEMELTPEIKDCNIGQLSETLDIGNEKIDELSKYMGTTTGFYGNGMPNFKILTPDDWESLIEDQMQNENLNIGSKLFSEDRRSPDMYLRKQVFCKGNYPNGICPFEPSPTPTP